VSFFRRFFGAFFEPGRTFQSLAERPVWVDSLVVILVAYAAFSYLVFPIGQKDSLRLLEENAARFTEKYGAEQYAAAVNRIQDANRTLASCIISPVTLLIGFLFSSLVALGLGKTVSTQGHYLQVFSCLVHANFVDKFLGNGVRLALISARGSTLQTSTGLPVFFPHLAATSTAYAALNQVDFFQIWMFGLLGLGLASAFKVSVKKGLAISYTLWLLKGLLMFGFALLQRRFFQ
jgi:hypothetical protein